MYNNILLPIDLNQESSWKRALPTAVEYCRAFGARLHLLAVVPDLRMPLVAGYFPKDFEKKALESAAKELEAFARDRVPGDVECRHSVAEGTVYEQILRVARHIDADLIVMASHRPELADYLIGPNAARVVRHYSRSVLVVRD